jgi:hypothetical protein
MGPICKAVYRYKTPTISSKEKEIKNHGRPKDKLQGIAV